MSTVIIKVDENSSQSAADSAAAAQAAALEAQLAKPIETITPADVPEGVGVRSWNAVEPGPYPNCGGIVIPENCFAIIKRDAAGAFSFTKTDIELGAYAKTTGLYNHDNRLLDGNKTLLNKFANAIDYDYPSNIFNQYSSTGSKSVVLEDNTNDSPFDLKILPKIIKYQWVDDVEEKKFEFLRSLILGANGLTFSFWMKQSELTTNGCNSFSFYDGVDWRLLTIPTVIGDFSAYGVSKLKLNHIYGDWINLVYTADETLSVAGFMLRFNVTLNYSTGFFHIANVFGHNDIIDVDPFSVRSKYKDLSLSGLLYDKNAPLDAATWGDSVTAGTDGDETFSYQYYLRPLIAKKYNIINCGVGGENVPTIAARQGGLPAYTQYGIVLPAEQTPVIIGNDADSGLRSSYDYSIVSPLKQWGWEEDGHAKINPCYIDGQKCIMKYSGGNYTLERYAPVSAEIAARGITSGSILITNACKTVKYADLNIIFVGINGGWSTPQDLADKVQKMINFCDSEKYIVMTQYVDGTGNSTQMLAVENEFYKRFAANAIFLRKYFVEHGLYDAGLTNTAEDIAAVAAGLTPPQLLADGTHPTQSTYNLIAKQIYQKMIELGFI